jgi:cell division protein ZapA
MSDIKQLEVQILQQTYLLGCPDGQEARLLAAVERVDTAMGKIREAGKVRARDRIAVLAALNLAFEIVDQAAAPAEQAAAGGDMTSLPDAARLHALSRRIDEALQGDDRLL